jgi:hypothetical protein
MEAAPPLPAKGKGPLIKGIFLPAFIGTASGIVVALFVFSFFIPKLIRKAKGE